MSFAIHWFRRDLRIAGNHKLKDLVKRYDGRVIGIFCLDTNIINRPDFSQSRFLFFLNTLNELRNEMKNLGGELLFIDENPEIFFNEFLEKTFTLKIDEVSWNEDYEPFALKRDSNIVKILKKKSINYTTGRDHLLIKPEEVLKNDGTPYKVFTPFSKKWLEIFESDLVQSRLIRDREDLDNIIKNKSLKINFDIKNIVIQEQRFTESNSDKVLNNLINELTQKVNIKIPKAGHREAVNKILEFKSKIESYAVSRDVPSLKGTSGISIYLKNGSITISQVINLLNLKTYKIKKSSESVYLSELIWREFYYHILFHYPHVETKSFNPKYDELNWENSKKLFEYWKNGKTGFPIVDAAMRQLNETGWMHNRLRMIVGSFLTKDLLIDYRWGEKYFMEKLLDGDLAANNGGWQWVSSTGVDASPYFRVFNPWLQGKKFDPNGDFIKKYIPELKNVKAEDLHRPNDRLKAIYMEPIVDHDQQRFKILKLFKEIN